MTTSSLLLLLITGFQTASGVSVVVPNYPPLAVGGGVVAAVVRPSADAENRVDILYGSEPFVSSTREALVQWRLPAERRGRPALVVVNYRDATISMLSTTAVDIKGADRKIIGGGYGRQIPVPQTVTDPLFSQPNVIVLGASVLHLKVSDSGSVGEVEVMKDLGSYSQASIEAVKKWKFAPARDVVGRPVASDAFAVCLYRPLQPSRKP